MPDCDDGDNTTVGATRTQGTVTTVVAEPEPLPLAAFDAAAETVLLPAAVPAGGVTVNVLVAAAPEFAVTDVGLNVPDHPEGTVDASAKVPEVQFESLLVTVTV